MIKFSIIIPVYNVEPYLRECLESVLEQTCADWEAICVNDGSTDGSLDILQEYAAKDGRFNIITQHNEGAGVARNNALKIAQGQYVFFLDADDWILPNTLQDIEAYTQNGYDIVCFTGRRYIEERNAFNVADVLSPQLYQSGIEYYDDNALVQRDFAFVCIVLRIYRRQFIIDEGLLFQEGLSAYEDDLWVPQVCLKAKQVAVTNICAYIYRVRPNSVMTSINAKKIQDLVCITNKLALQIVPLRGLNKTIFYRALAHHYQAALSAPYGIVRKFVLPNLDWQLYYQVSRTKIRHRFNYLKYRLFYHPL